MGVGIDDQIVPSALTSNLDLLHDVIVGIGRMQDDGSGGEASGKSDQVPHMTFFPWRRIPTLSFHTFDRGIETGNHPQTNAPA